ncbi:MAG: hypothetical protein HHJ17_17795 [Rhodoferax sp.]|uniref:hypothetical protein n=1 Tax=Rhodoferax sp. TaxID=50421 RepID=UPI0017AC4B9D|nr:hypothetical protein [Rhodoferax sp.]NMM15374.1 hypothetical protein [Rhodoferax sp.]
MDDDTTPLHFGPLPTTTRVLEQILRAHQLGFRTAMLPTYESLTLAGLGPDQYPRAIEPQYVCDLA